VFAAAPASPLSQGRRTPRPATHVCRACFARSESGQVLAWGVVTLLAAIPLVFGVMGATLAYLMQAQVQAAADAAALAAAGEAALWESLTVSWHEYGCLPAQNGWVCRDGPRGTTNLGREYASQLFATNPDGLPGWAERAGCQAVGGDPSEVPPLPNPVTVCDAWQRQPGGFGLSYGLGFPPGSDPQGVANDHLRANTADLRAHGVGVAMVELRADDNTGEVDVAVQAIEPGNPLGVLLGRPVRATVEAGARRRVPVPAASGS
jgi:hypothetical protein